MSAIRRSWEDSTLIGVALPVQHSAPVDTNLSIVTMGLWHVIRTIDINISFEVDSGVHSSSHRVWPIKWWTTLFEFAWRDWDVNWMTHRDFSNKSRSKTHRDSSSRYVSWFVDVYQKKTFVVVGSDSPDACQKYQESDAKNATKTHNWTTLKRYHCFMQRMIQRLHTEASFIRQYIVSS